MIIQYTTYVAYLQTKKEGKMRKRKKIEMVPVTFQEYHEKYKTPIPVIAARCGLSFAQIYNLLKGGVSPTLKTALAIEMYTEGEVNCETLLPKEKMDEIKNNKYLKDRKYKGEK